MRREAGTIIDWSRVESVTCIEHEPRLHQLANALTGETPETLKLAEILCVEGDSWEALESGRGRIGLRTEPGWRAEDEADLLPKIQSKMQTSTLLAGFSSTVFGVILTQSDFEWRGRAPRTGHRARRAGKQ